MKVTAHCPTCGQAVPAIHRAVVDTEGRALRIGDRIARLTQQEFDAFHLLYKRRPRLVTKESLIIDLWQDDEPEWPDSSLKTVICKIRGALRYSTLHIETVHGSGYRMLELTPGK